MPSLPRALAAAALLGLAVPASAPVMAQEAPAAPRNNDGRNIALSLAALAAIALAVREAREDEEEREEEEREEERREREARRVPLACLAEWPVRGEWVAAYDPACLEERFARAADLPVGCAVTFRSRGRFVSGFDPACLRNEGWPLEE